MFLSISLTVNTMLRNQLVLNKSLSVRWKKVIFFLKEERERVNWNVKNSTRCLREAPGVSFCSHNVILRSDFGERYWAPFLGWRGGKWTSTQMMDFRVSLSTNSPGCENENEFDWSPSVNRCEQPLNLPGTVLGIVLFKYRPFHGFARHPCTEAMV